MIKSMEENMTNTSWNENELNFLKENYETMSSNEISIVLGRTKNAVTIKANKLGLKKPSYTYSRDFFKEINTEEKAYWLGFLVADGYVSKTKDNTSWSVGIDLKKSDYKHLKKFNKSLNGNVEVVFRDRERFDRICEIASIRFFSKEMAEDLVAQGCGYKKTFDIEFPKNIKEDLLRHFIRGFFDGDGSLYFYNHSEAKHIQYVGCNFTSASEGFLLQLREELYNLDIFSFMTKFRNCHQLSIRRQADVLVFLKYLYDDSTVYLDRKFNLYKSLAPSLSNK